MKLTQIQEIWYDFLRTLATNSWDTRVSFRWWLDYEHQNEYRIVPEWFKTNLWSVPPLLHIIADDDDFPIAFTWHDFDYSTECVYIIKSLNNLSPKMKKWIKYWVVSLRKNKIVFIPNRKFADLVLFDTIQVEWLSKIKSRLVYFGVRLWWRPHFRNNI